MPERASSSGSPLVPCRVELVDSLGAAADRQRPAYSRLESAIGRGLAEVLTSLGVPGQPAVEIATAGETLLYGRFMQVLVNGRPCRYHQELLAAVQSYSMGQLIASNGTPAAVLEWLAPLVEAQSDQAIEFLAMASVEIAKLRPRLLLDVPHVDAYMQAIMADAETASSPGPLPGAVVLTGILQEVLDARISITDRASVATVLRNALGTGRDARSIAEDLIESLRPRVIELHMPQTDLQQFTTTWQEVGAGRFAFLRDGLFEESGLVYPDFSFVARDDLKSNTFRFRINHVTTPPFVSVGPLKCLVNEVSSKLPTGVSGEPAANPVTRFPQTVVDSEGEATRGGRRADHLDQLDYLVLCLAETLRIHSAAFVDRRIVQRTLRTLGGAFPKLAEAVGSRWSVEQITQMMRRLADERVSIRNVRLILEALVDADPAAATDLSSVVRQALRRQIGAQESRGTSTVTVYLLGERLEAAVRGAADEAAQGSERADRLTTSVVQAITDVLDQLRKLAPSALTPSLLAFADVRRPLRDVIAPELPRLHVIAFPEIPPLINVQPIDRIELPDDAAKEPA